MSDYKTHQKIWKRGQRINLQYINEEIRHTSKQQQLLIKRKILLAQERAVVLRRIAAGK